MDWISPGEVKYRALYAANKLCCGLLNCDTNVSLTKSKSAMPTFGEETYFTDFILSNVAFLRFSIF